MSVLSNFFQISMLLMIFIFIFNAMFTQFTPTLLYNGTSQENILDCSFTRALTSSSTQIQQQNDSYTVPPSPTEQWTELTNCSYQYILGYQIAFSLIFDTLGVPSIGTFLSGIFLIFQSIGVAYVIFALISTYTGGGSP